MRLKTFIAKSMPEAMRQVVKELGEDAVIVSSRKTREGMIKVTAALDTFSTAPAWDEPSDETLDKRAREMADNVDETAIETDDAVDDVPAREALFGAPQDMDVSKTDARDDLIDTVTNLLLRHNVPSNVADKIIYRLERIGQGDLRSSLESVFDDLYVFETIPDHAWKKPVMLVGVPGTGKTLTVAKLAARGVIAGLDPVVITADTMRAGAMEQLAAYTRVLDLDLHTVTSAEGLADAVLAHKGADQIIIDSPGLNPFELEDMKELATYVRSAKMNVVLVMAGGTDPEEASEIARAFEIVGAKAIVPTRLDMSRRLGGILAAADAANLVFAGAGNGAHVADGFLELDAGGLTDFILPRKKTNKDGKR